MSHITHADLGGQRGHGAVVTEPEGNPFHAPWEARALAVVLAMGGTGVWNIDMSRAARETLPDYARLSYYEIWLAALEKLLAERRLVGRGSPQRLPRKLMAADVPGALARGTSSARPAAALARFATGQAVRMFAGEVPHHTRLPAYVRGRRGVVEHVHGAHVFADSHALGLGEQPQWLYTVAFKGSELWPGEAQQGPLTVSVDAWEPYLGAA